MTSTQSRACNSYCLTVSVTCEAKMKSGSVPQASCEKEFILKCIRSKKVVCRLAFDLKYSDYILMVFEPIVAVLKVLINHFTVGTLTKIAS